MHSLKKTFTQKQSKFITFGIATTIDDQSKIYDLRKSVYKNLNWHHLLSENWHGSFTAYDKLDDYAHIFFLKVDGNVIATCRVVQLNLNKPFLESVLRFTPTLNPSVAVIIERLVLHESFRDSATYKSLLATTCQWVEKNTNNTLWYAKCKHTLTYLYLKFNAKVIGTEKQILPEGKEENYQYLQGVIKETSTRSFKFILPY